MKGDAIHVLKNDRVMHCDIVKQVLFVLLGGLRGGVRNKTKLFFSFSGESIMCHYRYLIVAALAIIGLMVGDARAEAVAVGNSALIGALDYSDTFTLAANGGLAGRTDGAAFSSSSPVENCYSSPARTWPYNTTIGTFRTDATHNIVGDWPGSSGAGSDTGMLESGTAKVPRDFGIAYDLRNVFTVQFDATFNPYTVDRYNITVAPTINGLAGANGISVFIRMPNEPHGNGQIALYNSSVKEKNTGLTPNITAGWHNIAVKFDLDARLLDFYVDQSNVGQIDLTTFEGGAFANQVTATTNDNISIGWAVMNWDLYGHTPTFWIDNFQVGNPIPEPSTVALLAAGLIGLLAYAWRKRR